MKQLEVLYWVLDRWVDALETGIDEEEDVSSLLNTVCFAIKYERVGDVLKALEPLSDTFLAQSLSALPQDAPQPATGLGVDGGGTE